MFFKDPTIKISVVDLSTPKVCIKWTIERFLGFTRDEVVSQDFLLDARSSIVDVKAKNFHKLVSWYDNEWGYFNRALDLAVYLAQVSKL